MQTIPTNKSCKDCGNLTWREELGAADRHWFDGFVCEECARNQSKPWIGLVSPQGHTEYNARFVLGDNAAEKLEHGKWYTNQELIALAGRMSLLRASSQAVEKSITKWRCDISSGIRYAA